MVSNTWASCATSPTTVRCSSPVERVDLDAVERDRAGLRRGGSAAARPRAWTCRRRSARRPPRAGPAEVEVDAVERPACPRPGSAVAPRARTLSHRARRARSGMRGLGHRRRRVHHLEHARGRRRVRAAASASRRAARAPARRPRAGSARAPRAARRPAPRRAPPRRRPAASPTSPARSSRLVRPWPTPAVRALAAAIRVSSASARARPRELRRAMAPLTASSGAPSIRSTTDGGQLRARRACRASPRAASAAGQPRHERRREQQRAPAGSDRRREHPPHRARPSPRPTQSGDRERRHHAQQQVLQRVDVVHQARQQIAAAKGRQAGRGEPPRGVRRRPPAGRASTRKAASCPTNRSP